MAELSEAAALRALDALLARGLVRSAGAPRRFAFRHPLVRHAVYVATPGGWRLGAHDRAAQALERHGAGAVARAHHVEHAARPGDEQAITLLAGAARELQSAAPGTAARSRPPPCACSPSSRSSVSGARRCRRCSPTRRRPRATRWRRARRCSTRCARPPATSASRSPWRWPTPNGGWGATTTRGAGCTSRSPSCPPSLRPIGFACGSRSRLTALFDCDLHEAQAQASDARDDARALGDPVFELAALAGGALAAGRGRERPGRRRLDESAAALERLTGEQLATRLPALWMHARARHALGRFDAALADCERGPAIAAEPAASASCCVLTIESVATLLELGRLAEATTAAEEGIELARLSGQPRMLLWAHSTLASARLMTGDVAGALAHASEARRPATPADFHAAGQPGWCLGAALVAAGNPERAVTALLEAFGGPALSDVLPVDRPRAAADLVEAQLAAGDVAAAEATLAHGEAAAVRVGTAWAAAVTGVARPRCSSRAGPHARPCPSPWPRARPPAVHR